MMSVLGGYLDIFKRRINILSPRAGQHYQKRRDGGEEEGREGGGGRREEVRK